MTILTLFRTLRQTRLGLPVLHAARETRERKLAASRAAAFGRRLGRTLHRSSSRERNSTPRSPRILLQPWVCNRLRVGAARARVGRRAFCHLGAAQWNSGQSFPDHFNLLRLRTESPAGGARRFRIRRSAVQLGQAAPRSAPAENGRMFFEVTHGEEQLKGKTHSIQ